MYLKTIPVLPSLSLYRFAQNQIYHFHAVAKTVATQHTFFAEKTGAGFIHAPVLHFQLSGLILFFRPLHLFDGFQQLQR